MGNSVTKIVTSNQVGKKGNNQTRSSNSETSEPKVFDIKTDSKRFFKSDGKPHSLVLDLRSLDDLTIDIDQDEKPDISHPRALAILQNKYCPKAETGIYKVGSYPDDFLSDLKNIKKHIDNGEKIDSISMPVGYPLDISQLGELTDLPLTSSNVSKYREKIIGKLQNLVDDPEKAFKKLREKYPDLDRDELNYQLSDIKDLISSIKIIEYITCNKKIPVYNGAGNYGSSVDFLSLSKGIKNVGAYENGKKAEWSGSLANLWEEGVVKIKLIKDKGVPLGYDLTGDGKVDVSINETSNKKMNFFTKLYLSIFGTQIKGTSASVPIATGKFLQKKYSPNNK